MSVPRFKISKPSTSGDDGSPSQSCHEDMKRVFRFIEDERHLIANNLYKSVVSRLDEATENEHPNQRLRFARKAKHAEKEKQKDHQAARDIIEAQREALDTLEERCRIFAKAKGNLIDNNNWTLAQTLFGITTYYRREVDGSLSIKMEGKLEGVSLFDQVAVLREVDLHYKWAPFVSSSLTIAHLDKLDTVGWFVVGLPSFGLMRDACFRAIGCDSMLEDGSVLLVAQGVADKPKDGVKNSSKKVASGIEEVSALQKQAKEFEYLSKDPVLEQLDLPAPPTGMGKGRITIRAFQSLIHIDSPTSARTSMIANVDPNLPFVPQSLLDFLMKKLCGVLLYKLQHTAKKVSKDPIYNPHASKMRSEEAFYKGWLMEKFKAVCKVRGWTLPTFACFELSDQQMELAQAADQKRIKNEATKAIKFYHSLTQDNLDDFLGPDSSLIHSEPSQVGKKNPKVRALASDESSVISDISRNSSSSPSLWQRNPISKYLQEVEEKTQLRKTRDIQRSRERAAKRLKPRELDEESRTRLDELRAARERRAIGMKAGKKPVIPPDATKSTRRLIKKQHRKDWATTWTSHGIFARLVTISSLMFCLFGLLYTDEIFERKLSQGLGEKWSDLQRNGATIAYLIFAALVHFCMCYIALMYAFSGLQLGSIAGKQARRFYSKNVHLLVGLSSFGMLALGMLKAALVLASRWGVNCFTMGWEKALEYGDGLSTRVKSEFPDMLESVEPFVDRATTVGGQISSVLMSSASSILKTTDSMLIQSNSPGRALRSSVTGLSPIVHLPLDSVGTFAEETMSIYNSDLEFKAWRLDALETTRSLLIYSGVFLIVFLTLFNLLARTSRHPNLEQNESTDDMQSMDMSELSVNTAMETEASSPRLNMSESLSSSKLSRSLSSPFETIQEGKSAEGTAKVPRKAYSATPSFQDSSSRSRRRRLTLRKKRGVSSVN